MNYETKSEPMMFGDGTEAPPDKDKEMFVDDIYLPPWRNTQLEHILLGPDTYIGSVKPVTQTVWVYDEAGSGMVQRVATFVPGLIKIFDEIIVNAAANKQRDEYMDTFKIDIDPENGKIVVYNNGEGLSVVEHQTEKVFMPTFIFGHLPTTSDCNNGEKKASVGRNGYGATLCNIFSSKFVVNTSCRMQGKYFAQEWTGNMTTTAGPVLKEAITPDFTRITFHPDLGRFGMEELDKDIVALMTRRVYDLAGTSKGVKVFLNGCRLPIRNFKQYVELYIKDKVDENGHPLRSVYESVNECWEVALTISEKSYQTFQQVSFVNCIATTKGGKHVDHVVDQIVGKLMEVVKKKNKSGIQIKPSQVKNHMWVFVNCLIENPTFDSPSRENMTLQGKSFGSKCTLSQKFFAQLLKCGIVESILSWCNLRSESKLNKKCRIMNHSKLKRIPRLEDAKHAGTKMSSECTLILTEGDPAKTLALSGLSVIGRDKYGVFPLKGKLLNVREASTKQVADNDELQNIVKILGLQYNKDYESCEAWRSLRYGKLMIMANQDQDGSHVKGLLINFIHNKWPSLLKRPFLEEFITPVVKVSKGQENLSFFSLPEFEDWKKVVPDEKAWTAKYYKGLGTLTTAEVRELFSNMHRYRVGFKYQGTQDDSSIELAFSKKMVEQRKGWLTNYMKEKKTRRELGLPETSLYNKDTKLVTYEDFVNKELVLFSNMDNERSIPNLVDGMKPGSRKVIFTCLTRSLFKEIKVAELAGSVIELSSYDHGENSLQMTIIKLAQNFVGSNNINLLVPNGQFGTRLQGGKDHFPARSIYTQISTLTPHIFSNMDAPLLNHMYDGNKRVEPEYYVPIIPMVLVNGAEGIGTGWMTLIHSYNPRDIVNNLRRMINDEEPENMVPWFKNFRGKIVAQNGGRFLVSSEVNIIGGTMLEITELPVHVWTQTYKDGTLEPMLQSQKSKSPLISDYKDYSTDEAVRFVVTLRETIESDELYKVFKLSSMLNTTSMVLFDANGCLKRYETVTEILREFYDIRLKFYDLRKSYLIGLLSAELLKLENQVRFVHETIEGKVTVERTLKNVFDDMQIRGFDSDPVIAWEKQRKQVSLRESDSNPVGSEGEAPINPDYKYLVLMPILYLAQENLEELLLRRDEKRLELEALKTKTAKDIWKDDLDAFMNEFERIECCATAEQQQHNLKGGAAGTACQVSAFKRQSTTMEQSPLKKTKID